jgi:hypothetical protein
MNMSSNLVTKSRTVPGVCFAVLTAVFGPASCGGSINEDKPAPVTPPIVLPPSIADVSAAWAATPYLGGNSVQYFCDCSGPNATCSASGVDANDGTQAHPKKTMSAAVAWVNGALYRTAALCQGGSFVPPSPVPQYYTYRIGNTGCAAGTICNELREYPVGGTGAKPIINNPAGPAQHYLFFVNSANNGGMRLLNLRLQGVRTTSGGSDLNWGMLLYAAPHDWTFGNVTFDSFDLGLAAEDPATSNNIMATGNTFNNIEAWGILGSSNNLKINYNAFFGTGGNNAFNHAIYTGSAVPVDGIEIIGNYISGFSVGYAEQNTQCIGVMISGGGEESNVVIRSNTMVQDKAKVFGGCYGIAWGNHGYNVGGKLHNVEISDNVIVNGGNVGIGLQNCSTGCVIKNNVIYSDIPSDKGIYAVMSAARTSVGTCTPDSPVAGVTCVDEVSSNISVINNTIYATSNTTSGYTGIDVGIEGTGYVIANNTVTMMASTNGNGESCFSYGLAPSAYSFINNNHCYSAASTYAWEKNHGANLATWIAYANSNSKPFDSASIAGMDPLLSAFDGTNFDTAFIPLAGSPLLDAGDLAHGSAQDISGKARPTPPATNPAIGAREP